MTSQINITTMEWVIQAIEFSETHCKFCLEELSFYVDDPYGDGEIKVCADCKKIVVEHFEKLEEDQEDD